MSGKIKPLILGLLITFALNGIVAVISTALSDSADDLQVEQAEGRSE